MENYLKIFEKAIKKQSEAIGKEKALEQAKKAGLGVSKAGRIVSCVGNPQVVLLKLIKFFVATGRIDALQEVTTIINELVGDETVNLEEESQKV